MSESNLIATYRECWGYPGECPTVHVSAGRNAVAFVTGGLMPGNTRRVAFGDREIENVREPFAIVPELFRCAISPDGTKVAVLRLTKVKDGYWYGVSINGTPTYEMVVGSQINLLAWLSDNELVWTTGRSATDPDAPATYVNGVGVAGMRVLMSPGDAPDNVSGFVVEEPNGTFYHVSHDGERSSWPPEFPLWDASSLTPWNARVCESPAGAYVARGGDGPVFASVVRLANWQKVAYDRSARHIAYVGVRAGWAAKVAELTDDLGIAPFIERYVVVCDQVPWKRRFAHPVSELIVSPAGSVAAVVGMRTGARLAVDPLDGLRLVAPARNGCKVVVDEVDGPDFDEILAPTWLPSANCFAYVGRLGNNYYSVRVS